MKKKHEVSTDARMNEQLREEVQELRGGIMGQAEKQPLPERFVTEPHRDHPSIVITDTTNGRSTTVPLFAYREVRRALAELLSPPDER